MSKSTTLITRTYSVPISNMFQDMTQTARAYTSIFPESDSPIVDGNDIVRIDMQHEQRFNDTLKSLARPYETISRILAKYPKQVYMAGGLVNLALDPLIDSTNPVFAKSDIDLFILAEPGERMKIVTDILNYLYGSLGHDDNDMNRYCLLNDSQMCVGVRGSVVYVWHNRFKRMIQLVLMDIKNYPTIDSVIKGFDLDNIAVAYSGREIIIQQRAWQAMITRRATYRPTSVRNDNQIYRMTKTASRGYKVFSQATGAEITPSLAQILVDKESRDYLCTPHADYMSLFQRFLNENDDDWLAAAKAITEYYKVNSTASEVFYIDQCHRQDIISKVIPLVNSGGITNIESSREYCSVPDSLNDEQEFEIVDGTCAYVSYNKKMKVITLNTIDSFNCSDITLASLNDEYKKTAFPYYATMRRDVCLEIQVDAPITFAYNHDMNHLVKLCLSESDIPKFLAFINKFVTDASNLFYMRNHRQVEFAPNEKINELTKRKSISANTLVESPRVDKVDKIVKQGRLMEASKSTDGRTVRLCVNAFVRGRDIDLYTRAKAKGKAEVKPVEVSVSYHLCL